MFFARAIKSDDEISSEESYDPGGDEDPPFSSSTLVPDDPDA